MLARFAHPAVGDYVALYNLVTDKLFYALADRVEQRQAAPTALSEMTKRPLEGRGWRPPVGFVRSALEEEPEWAALQMAVLAHGAGVLTDFSMEIPEGRQPLMVGGRVLPPAITRVDAQADVLRVTTSHNTLDFSRDENGLVVLDSSDVIKVRGHHPLLKSRGDWLDYRPADDPMAPLAEDPFPGLAAMDQVLEVIEEWIPEYALWVLLPLKELTFLQPLDDRGTQSRSSPIYPGNVQLTSPTRLPRIVAQLVHECSHQYFHLGQWLGLVTEPGAPMAYSILKNRQRPLDRVLLGYHAFANIYLALTLLRSRGFRLQNSDLDDEIVHTRRGVDQLGGELETNQRYLTSIGRDLYEPLRDAVEAVG